MRRSMLVLLAAVLFVGASDAPALKVVEDAAKALGGKERVQAVKTLVIEGEGTGRNIGQNLTPDPAPAKTNPAVYNTNLYKITGFKQAIDLENGRMRTEQLRTPLFPFVNPPARQNAGLDGDVAYNIGGNGNAARASALVARDRRAELRRNPIAIVRAALDASATVSNLRRQGNRQVVDVTTANGDKLTLAVDNTTKLPVRVTSMSDNANLGDSLVETTFADYQDVNGLKLPQHVVTTFDRYLQLDLQVSKYSVNTDAGALAASDAVKSAAVPPAITPATANAEELGKGIWLLTPMPGGHRSVVLEFNDHLTLFEVPGSEAITQAYIAKAKSLRPDKPLTHAIVSHHHFDHEAGLRAAVAEGLTIITYKANEAPFKELMQRKHTIAPDTLARNPKPIKLQLLDDELTLKDQAMEVRLYHVLNDVHAATQLMGYVPQEKMIIHADMYNQDWSTQIWGDVFLQNLERRKLVVEKVVGVHQSKPQTYAEMVQTIRAAQPKPSGN